MASVETIEEQIAGLDSASFSSLQFKKVGKVWSARVDSHYRAVAAPIEDGFLWVWVGTHAEYDKLIT